MHLVELRAFFNEERTRRGVSWADISKETKIAETTVRKIFSGHTNSPSYDNIMDLIAFFGMPKDPEKKEAIEAEVEITKLKEDDSNIGAAVKTLNDVYEAQIDSLKGNLAAMRTMYEERIHELKESMHETVAAVNNDKRAWQIACIALGVALAALVIADFAIGSHGWIKY